MSYRQKQSGKIRFAAFSSMIRSAVPATCLFLGLMFVTLFAYRVSAQSPASQVQTPGLTQYLPIVTYGPSLGRVPQHTATITLPGAMCPNDLFYSEYNDMWYVLNTDSGNVSLVNRAGQYRYNLHVGGRPTEGAASRTSSRVYISNLPEPAPPASPAHSIPTERTCDNNVPPGLEPACISVLDADSLVTQYNPQYEPFAVRVHPNTDQMFVTDLDSALHIFNGTTHTTTSMIDGSGNRIGWAISMAHDPLTGITYLPSWENGMLYLFDGTNVTQTFSYKGWGAQDIELHETSGYLYIANSQATIPSRPSNNISIAKRGSTEITQISTATGSQHVAINQWNGYVYVTSQLDNIVTVLKDGQLVKAINLGGAPRDVEVNPWTGYAFIPLLDKNELVVMAADEIVARYPTGNTPFSVGVNAEDGETWVVMRNSTTSYDELNRPFEECFVNPTINVYK